MYAGPLPEIAVTASWYFSGDLDDAAARAQQRLGLLEVLGRAVLRPGEIAAIPWSTRAGVLGMTRTTDEPSGSRDSR